MIRGLRVADGPGALDPPPSCGPFPSPPSRYFERPIPHEVDDKVEAGQEDAKAEGSGVRFGLNLAQILPLDIVFLLDSVTLAIAMATTAGVMLLTERLGQQVSKGHVYVSIAFSLLVGVLKMRLRKKQKPVHLRGVAELSRATWAPALPS